MHRRWLEPALAIVVVAWGLWCSLQSPDLCWFNTHMARDVRRALDWAGGTPHSWGGPELNYGGGQLPGPALALYTAFWWDLCQSLPALISAMHAVTVVLSLALAAALRRDLGRGPAWFFLLVFLLMPVHVSLSRTLWNPSQILTVDLAMLLCARAWLLHPGQDRYGLGFFGAAWVAVQVHLSTLVPFLAMCLALARQPQLRSRLLLGASLLVGYLLAFQALSSSGGDFRQSLSVQYSWPEFTPASLARFLRRWYFDCFLDPRPLNDYELFPLLFRVGRAVCPERFARLQPFLTLGPALVLGALLLVARGLRQKASESPLVQFYWHYCGLTLLLGWTPLFFYTAKGGVIPYRYGMMLYPVQFLLPALALGRLPGWQRVALPLAALVYLGDGTYLLASYRVMEATGRASHVQQDTYELTLRAKLQIVAFGLAHSPSANPYEVLHGPLVNKIRLKDGDWDQQTHYDVLPVALPHPTPPPPAQHYWVRGFDLARLQANAQLSQPRFPFDLIPLAPQDLPSQVELRYFNEDDQLFLTVPWQDGGSILPLARPLPQPPFALELRAQLLPSPRRVLRICYDSSPRGSILDLQEVRLEGQSLTFRADCPGWLAQSSTAIVLPPTQQPLSLWARFGVGRPKRCDTRLDLFRTPGNVSFTPF